VGGELLKLVSYERNKNRSNLTVLGCDRFNLKQAIAWLFHDYKYYYLVIQGE
jgi:hypothetical protein